MNKKLRKFILNSLKVSSTAEEVETKFLSSGLLERAEKRRIRGMLLGLSQGKYVVRVVRNDREYFQAA